MSSLAARIVSNLPDNAQLALLEIRDRIEIIIAENSINSGTDAAQILAVVEVWAKKYGQDANWKMPNFTASTSQENVGTLLSSIKVFERHFQVDTAAAETEKILDLEDQIRRKETFGIAILSDDDKNKIRFHIENIRSYIKESELTERKRVALLSRLSQLELELETLGTRTDRFFAFMGDAAFVLGDIALKAKPFTQEVKDIMKIVLQGREDAEGVRLPRKGDDILLPPPEE